MNFDQLLEILHFPINIGKVVRNRILKDERRIQQISRTAYQGDYFEFQKENSVW